VGRIGRCCWSGKDNDLSPVCCGGAASTSSNGAEDKCRRTGGSRLWCVVSPPHIGIILSLVW